MMIWYDDVARSGRCAYMLGLSVKLCYMVEGTLFFSFSFHPTSFSVIFFICFLSSSPPSSSSSNLSFYSLPFLFIFLHSLLSLCLLYSSSLLFFPVLSSLSYLSLIFLFIILFFGNPLYTLLLLWSSFSFSSSSSDLSSSIPISVFFIILIS